MLDEAPRHPKAQAGGKGCSPPVGGPLPEGVGGGHKGVLQSGELELGLSSSQTQGPSLLPGDMLTPGIRVLAAMTGQH